MDCDVSKLKERGYKPNGLKSIGLKFKGRTEAGGSQMIRPELEREREQLNKNRVNFF